MKNHSLILILTNLLADYLIQKEKVHLELLNAFLGQINISH